MAELNGVVGTYTTSHDDLLASLSFPYRIASYAGPASAGVKDEILLDVGTLVCYDATSGKLRKYVTGDNLDTFVTDDIVLGTPIEGIVAEKYDSSDIASGEDAGLVSVYIFGAYVKEQFGTLLANQKIWTDTGASATVTNKVILNSADISALRDRGLYIQ